MNLDVDLQWDENRTVRVVFNERVADLAIIMRDALLTSREILQPQEITSVNVNVLAVLKKGYGFGEEWDEDTRIKKAVEYVRRDLAKQQQRALSDALEAALLDANFIERQSVPIQVRVNNFDDITVPASHWDDSATNANRDRSMLPPIYRRLRSHPDEQRVALTDLLKRGSPRFNIAFANVFDAAATAITKKLLGAQGEQDGEAPTGREYTKSGASEDPSVDVGADHP